LNGDYSVCANMLSGASGCYGYDESSLGIAFKPTFIIQPTLYIKQKLAITVYFGTAAFLAVDFVNYVGKPINGFDEDEDEVALYPKVPKLIYGYDIAFKGLFSQDDVIRLSSTLSYATSDENEDLSEIVVLYEIPF
ncbi:MAG: hypothetical protein OEZ58_17890, partial [Gammaproteobacteria bacterium]|nr:hypothetical protein [Gammaproteobacteria bacterium]